MRWPWLVLAVLALHAPGEGPAVAGSLELSVGLSDSVFFEQEPIHAFISCRNTLSTPVEIRSLNPQNQFLRLKLSRLNDGSRVESYGLFDMSLIPRPSRRLAPGENEVELTNLLTQFGSRDRARWALSDAIGQGSLPAGRYRLDCTLTLTNRDRASEVKAEPAYFRVASLGDYPEEQALVERFVRECRPGESQADDVRSCSRLWLDRFAGTRMFSYIFYAAGFPGKEMDPSHLIAFLEQSEPNPRRRAARLWILCAVQTGDPDMRARWMKGVSDAIQGQLGHDVIATWLRRSDQVERAAH